MTPPPGFLKIHPNLLIQSSLTSTTLARSHQAWLRWRREWRGSWNYMIATSLIIKVHATEASDREQKNETFYK